MLEIVNTKYGKVKGYPGNNQFITVFKGIPFAKPPIGDLRWREPKKLEPWDGILNAYKYASIPWQDRFSSEGGILAANEFYVRDYERDEDCLYLNIFTPAKSKDEKLPVAIYIHGGGYETGYSYLNAYDGESFAKEGIVYITITYRLNVFGFLAHEELDKESENNSSGNYGLLDQVAAVNWVFENIENFGGDPNKVVLMGQSAGGSSVQNLIETDLLENKIKRAIMQSGGGFNYKGALEPLEHETAKKFGKSFLEFIKAGSVDEARKIPAKKLLEQYIEFKKVNNNKLMFIPNIDDYSLKEESTHFLKSGKHPDIDYLIGATSDEMRDKSIIVDEKSVENFAERRFERDIAKDFIEKMQDYKDEYFNDNIGDEMRAATVAFCENQIRIGYRPAYLYRFNYVPPGAEKIGAHHSVEHHYVFKTLNRSNRDYKLKDYKYALLLSKLWANFIKNGNPSTEDFEWKPYEKSLKEAMLIEDKGIFMGKIKKNKKEDYLIKYFLNK